MAKKSTKSLTTRSFNPEPLREARLLRGMTYTGLGKRINRSPSCVWFTLQGVSASPPVVYALCAELGIRPEQVWQ